MNPSYLRSGWWVSTDERFVTCYNTKEEAIEHVKYQKERMGSKKNWYINHIKVDFLEHMKF